MAPELVLDISQWVPREMGVTRDYLYRDAQNTRLGRAGELAAIEFEKRRLHNLGRPELAAQVEHSSDIRGDGLGYDILSFETSGKERFIEVKTTLHARETPFFVTGNELSASEYFAGQYHLYRLFQFKKRSGMYQLAGSLHDSCDLRAREFVAVPK